jgi:tetratricopeptide (TPR) repeat protein
MMKRRWSSIAACVATSFAIAGLSAVADTAPTCVDGGMVDPDMPATYRLPPVASAAEAEVAKDAKVAITAVKEVSPLFSAPTTPEATLPVPVEEFQPAVTTQVEKFSTSLPAGAPPDDGRARDAAAGSGAAIVVASRDVTLPSAPPSEPSQTVAAVVARTAPPTSDLSVQLLSAVQRGTGLAERGALFAARTEFIQVLRRLAQGKDAAINSNEHSRSLAAGLRALDEAEDFVPDGVQLEAEMNIRSVASSHRTRVLPEDGDVTPFDAVALYHTFAQDQLAKAAAGERAGSMALYGLGRVHARLAAQSDDDAEQIRAATTMYAASLAACPDNHLASNELGVLVCRAGRVQEATELFQQAINFAPTATAYHNLAMAQQRMGMHSQSAANEQEAVRLAALERARGDVSRRAGVRWVAPEELARTSQPNQWTAENVNRAAPEVAEGEQSEKFQISKLFNRSGDGETDEARQLQSYPQATRPVGHAAGQRRWR